MARREEAAPAFIPDAPVCVVSVVLAVLTGSNEVLGSRDPPPIRTVFVDKSTSKVVVRRSYRRRRQRLCLGRRDPSKNRTAEQVTDSCRNRLGSNGNDADRETVQPTRAGPRSSRRLVARPAGGRREETPIGDPRRGAAASGDPPGSQGGSANRRREPTLRARRGFVSHRRLRARLAPKAPLAPADRDGSVLQSESRRPQSARPQRARDPRRSRSPTARDSGDPSRHRRRRRGRPVETARPREPQRGGRLPASALSASHGYHGRRVGHNH